MTGSRSKSYLLRMTEAEHQRLQTEAAASSMSMNDYLLHRTLGSTPSTPSAYASLNTRMETLESTLAGLDPAIAQAQRKLKGD